MQKLTTCLFLLILGYTANAQLSVLFVDDSGDNFGNAAYVASAFDSLGYETVYIDAIGQGISPTATDMSNYDLVVWYSSTWGTGLQLWNGADTDNPELVKYLKQPDAHLWLIGLDYFYDRYGSAPVTFQSGDFAYEHLGIAQYEVQSYADDGSLGVPLVQPAPGQPIPGLQDLSWIYPTLWYADGFQLRPEATPVYMFGDNSYVLKGKTTGALYHPANQAQVLTYGFDLALVANFNLLKSHVSTVMDWWDSELSATHTPAGNVLNVKVSPTHFYDQINIQINAIETNPVSIQIYNADGRLVYQNIDQQPLWANEESNWSISVPAGLPSGFYYCKIQLGDQSNTVKLVKSR